MYISEQQPIDDDDVSNITLVYHFSCSRETHATREQMLKLYSLHSWKKLNVILSTFPSEMSIVMRKQTSD